MGRQDWNCKNVRSILGYLSLGISGMLDEKAAGYPVDWKSTNDDPHCFYIYYILQYIALLSLGNFKLYKQQRTNECMHAISSIRSKQQNNFSSFSFDVGLILSSVWAVRIKFSSFEKIAQFYVCKTSNFNIKLH